jgi:hypothetical protein
MSYELYRQRKPDSKTATSGIPCGGGLIAAAACLFPAIAGAHHSNAPHYDRNRPIEIEGVVEEFEFVNPHVFLHIAVEDESGQTEVWSCEMQAANTLRRIGWTAEQFVVGESVKISGIAARRDPLGCSFDSAVMADGTVVERSGEIVRPETTEEKERVAFLEGGVPNLAGPWRRDQRRPQGGPGPQSAAPDDDRFTAAGLAANAGYDQRFDDPSFECSAASIPRAWGEPGTPTEILQFDDRVEIRHEYMDTVRTIRLGREHEDDLTPRPYGHSIGWYEGTTLVIDTIGFTAGVLTPHPGILHSDALHVVERLTVNPDEPSLDLQWTAEDPEYFNGAISGSTHYIPSLYAVSVYGCTPERANR